MRKVLTSKLFASKKITDYSVNMSKNLSLKIIDEIQNQSLDFAPESFRSYLMNLRISITESFQKTIENEIKPLELNFGTHLVNGKEKKINGFIIDLDSILKLYWNHSALYSVLKTFVEENRCKIKLGLYHDEICLVNPIGNI